MKSRVGVYSMSQPNPCGMYKYVSRFCCRVHRVSDERRASSFVIYRFYLKTKKRYFRITPAT